MTSGICEFVWLVQARSLWTPPRAFEQNQLHRETRLCTMEIGMGQERISLEATGRDKTGVNVSNIEQDRIISSKALTRLLALTAGLVLTNSPTLALFVYDVVGIIALKEVYLKEVYPGLAIEGKTCHQMEHLLRDTLLVLPQGLQIARVIRHTAPRVARGPSTGWLLRSMEYHKNI